MLQTALRVRATSLCCAKLQVSAHTSAMCAVGLFRVGRVVSVRRIIGTVISCSASFFTRIRWRTRAHSARQNWVSSSPAPFSLARVCCLLRFLSLWPRCPLAAEDDGLGWTLSCRSTGMAATCENTHSHPASAPHNLHATPPPCRNGSCKTTAATCGV
jgi:hypothetical protein